MKRTLMLLALLLVALTPLHSHAGSAGDPEIVDTAGDARWVSLDGRTNADWADIVAAWFTSRSTGGGVDAFSVHIAMAGDASAADDDAFAIASWRTEDGCYGELHVWITDHDESTSQPTHWPEPGAELTYGCPGEEGVTELLPVRIGLHPRGSSLALTTSGSVVSVRVPLELLNAGPSVQTYGVGTVLGDLWVTAGPLTRFGGMTIDDARGHRDFVIGS